MAELIYILCTAIVALCILAGYLKLKIQKLNNDFEILNQRYKTEFHINSVLKSQIKQMKLTASFNVKTIEKLNQQLKFKRNGKK